MILDRFSDLLMYQVTNWRIQILIHLLLRWLIRGFWLNYWALDKRKVYSIYGVKQKVKKSHYSPWTGPEDSRRLRLPDCKTI
jgi:hypothetical protein